MTLEIPNLKSVVIWNQRAELLGNDDTDLNSLI